MELSDYQNLQTDDEHVLRVFSQYKDDLLEEQNEEIDLLHSRIYNLRRKTARVDVSLTHNVIGIEHRVDMLHDEMVNAKEDLIEQKLRLSENAKITAQHDETLNKIMMAQNELEKTMSDIRDIELKRKKYSAYYADKCTLHLQYAYEGRGLYSSTTFNESISEQIEKMNLTKEQKLNVYGMYEASSVYAETFSFSASSITDSTEYVRRINDKVIYTLYVHVRKDNMLIIFSQEGARTERELPFSNEYGEIVYTVLIQAEVFQQRKSGRVTYRVRKGRVTLYSDKKLLDRAYNGHDAHYGVHDELFSRGFPVSMTLTDFLTSKYHGDSVPVFAIVARGMFPSSEKYVAAVHQSSKLYTGVLRDMMILKSEKERLDIMRKLNDETYRSENVLVSLLTDVNSLKMSTVRSVTANVSIQSTNIYLNPMIKPFTLQPPTTQPTKPSGDAWEWWKHSDPYLSKRESFDVQYEVTNSTPESSQAIHATIWHPESHSARTLHINGRMQAYCQPSDDTYHHFASTTGRDMFNYFIHVPYGRDEIASDNANGNITHSIQYEPQHVGDGAELYYGITMGARSQPTLRLKFYVSDALPTSAKIVASKDLRLYFSGTFTTCPTTWSTHVERDHSIERLVLTAVVDISGIFARIPGYVALARIDTKEGHAGARVTLSRKWRNEGFLTSDSAVHLSNDVMMKMAVTVSNPAGGHSIARRICKRLVLDGNQQSLPANYAERGMHLPTAMILSEKGWHTGYTVEVTLHSMNDTVTMEYLNDPINAGGVSYVDYAVNNIAVRFEDVVKQITDLHELISDTQKRLKYIEAAYDSRHSFVSGVLPMLAVATSAFNPLLGVVVSIIAETMSVSDMVKNGVTMESVTYVLTNLLDLLSAIAAVRGASEGWISGNAKYDVLRATADAQEQVMNIRLNEFSLGGRTLKNARLLNTHNVQIMHRPIEDFKFGGYYENVLKKMASGTASKKEVAIFNATSSMKLNPTHQYMRMSNVKRVDNHLYKDVWIFGVGDGYSKMVDRSWVGWGNTALAPRKTQGELSPGVFKMVFKKGANDVKWEALPHRSSGMTDVEILTAGGMVESAAMKYVTDNDASVVNAEVSTTYENLIDYYMYNSKALAVQEKNIQLFDGQLDVLHDTMRKASYDTYTYSLVGNNCQHFVDSTLLLLQKHTRKPDWMSDVHYAEYIKALDSLFVKYTH